MKKVLAFLLFVGVLAALFAGAASWAGARAEQGYRSALAALPPSPLYRVSGESYSRGVLASTARTRVELLRPPAEPVAFSLVHRIAHGPVVPSSGLRPVLAVFATTLAPAADSPDDVRAFFRDNPDLVAARDTTVAGLDGRVRSHLEVPPFRRPVGQKQVLVDWQGLTADTTFDPGLSGVRGDARLKGLEISDAESSLRIADVSGAFDTKKGILGLALGTSSVSAASVAIASSRAGEEVRLSFADVGLESGAEETGGLLAGDLSLRCGKFQTPALSGESMVFELQARNFDAAYVAHLRREADAAAQSHDAGKTALLAQSLSRVASEGLPAFLAKNPRIEVVRSEVRSDAGRFDGKLLVAIDAAGVPPQVDLPHLLPLLTVQADASADEGLLRRVLVASLRKTLLAPQPGADPAQLQAAAEGLVSAQLQGLVAKGQLRKEGAAYSVSLAYRGGKLSVNGRPLLSPGGI